MYGFLHGLNAEEKAVSKRMKHSARDQRTSGRLLRRGVAAGLAGAGLLAAGLSAGTPAFAAAPPSFNPVVAQAMAYVAARTGLPLQAPTFIGHANGVTRGYLAATASSSPASYHVSLQVSTTPVGLNSPALYQPPNTGLAAVIGGFGAQRVSSASQAVQDVALRMKPVAFAGVRQQLVKYTDVNLGNGIQGLYAYVPRAGGAGGTIEWREGEWALRITGSGFAADRSLAESIVAYLHTHLLPETHGLLTVSNGGDGQHTSLSFAFGNVVYTVWDYHHALSAISMAMSIQPYNMPTAAFPAAVQSAMGRLRGNTTAPLQAPRSLGLPLAQARLLHASTQSGKDYYQVNLQSSAGQGVVDQIGWFGAKVYVGQPAALGFLTQMAQAPQFAGLREHPVALGGGIIGKIYNQLGMVRWHEGLWTFNVQAGSDAADTALAKRMVAYLHTHLLPETNGNLVVKNTPQAEYTQMEWVWGNVLYNVYSAHSAMQALQMAVSYEAF